MNVNFFLKKLKQINGTMHKAPLERFHSNDASSGSGSFTNPGFTSPRCTS